MPTPRSTSSGRGTPPPAGDEPIWLRVGCVIDGSGGEPLRGGQIVYNRRGILWVGGEGSHPPAGIPGAAKAQPDLILSDHFLLPGLIEAHAHFFLEGGELEVDKRAAHLKQSNESLLAAAMPRLEKVARLGVAAVRDAGDKNGVGLALSRLYQGAGRPVMPYVDSPGAAIHRRGRYGAFMAEPLEDHASARECVAARVRAGADRIKLIPTGIINFKQGAVTSEPQLGAAEIAEIVAAARSFNRQTFAHASGDDGIEGVIEGGVDSVEHGFFVRQDQLARMRDRQIAWVPTFAPVQAQIDHAERPGWDATVVGHLRRILDQHAASLAWAASMGVPVIAGSDAGSYAVAHGTGFLAELELMERAGMPARAVIHAATGASARRLGFKEKFGFIKAGHLSRFILTRHSPLETAANLRKARIIVFDGCVFDTPENADAAGL